VLPLLLQQLNTPGADLDVKGIQGSINFDGDWVTITKRQAGAAATTTRFRAADVTGTRFKSATRFLDGYLQFNVPGSRVGQEGPNRRPTAADRHSLSFRKSANAEASQLLAAVEQARG
jgi:hypothetical protein